MQIAEPAVAQFCEEAESYLIGGRYSDLANLLLTSADLVLANASEKGESVLPLGCMKTPTTWLNILAVECVGILG